MKWISIAVLALSLLWIVPQSVRSASVGGSGGGHIIEDEGSALTQRGNLNFTGQGVTCSDSSPDTVCNIPGLDAPAATYYVCPQTGSGCTASASNTCKSSTATCPTIQDVLAKLNPVVSGPTEILVASGSYSTGSTNDARVYFDKIFTGLNTIKIRGYFNSTANSFTDSAIVTGTSSGSNVSEFPLTGASAAGSTTLNDTTKSWTTNQYADFIVKITGGTGFFTESGNIPDIRNYYVIRSNTATQISFVGRAQGSVFDATTTYAIYDPAHAPQLSGTGVNYCIRTQGADNIYLYFLMCSKSSTYTIYIENGWPVALYGVKVVGKVFGERSKIETRSLIVDADSEEYAIRHTRSLLLAYYTHVSNYAHYGVYSLIGSTGFIDSMANTALCCGGFSSNAAIYSDSAYGSLQYSLLVLTSNVSVSNTARFGWYGDNAAAVQALYRVRIACVQTSATSPSRGVFMTRNASFEWLDSINRVENCDTGQLVKQGSRLTVISPAAITYSGNTANETIDAATYATKLTSF